MIKKILLVLLTVQARQLLAQDTPYDDVDLKREEKGLPKETVEAQEALEQGQSLKPQRRRTPPLFRVGFKAGANFAAFQTTNSATDSTITITGVGFDALTSMGWDLPYQPIFLEFSAGYRQLFTAASSNSDALTITALHVLPVGLGIAYRSRTGPRSLMRLGLRPSLDFQIESTNNPLTGVTTTAFAVAPTFGIWWGFEVKDFLVELELSVMRIQTQHNFVASALRFGYRF